MPWREVFLEATQLSNLYDPKIMTPRSMGSYGTSKEEEEEEEEFT